MPRVWSLGLFSVVAWTLFLLLERAWPEAPAAVLLLLALAGGLAAATLDHRSSLSKPQRDWRDHVLFAIVMGGFGFIASTDFAPFFSDWFSVALVAPQPSMAQFMSNGSALLLFLMVGGNIAHRRRAAPPGAARAWSSARWAPSGWPAWRSPSSPPSIFCLGEE